ncbi:uncharacterized protein [Epargyreus clarus]|uniref:uncharacterized protein n=1 Tax=Epargyreus clarus TaxID=520877 RepID=UPI003C2BCCC5
MTTCSPPVTRRKLAEARAFTDAPASPSEPTRNVPPSGSASAREPFHTTAQPALDAQSVCSQRSTDIRRSELEAEKRLLEIRYRQLRLEAEIMEKQIAIDKVTSREETDRESVGNQRRANEKRVETWLNESQPRGERHEVDTVREVILEPGQPIHNSEPIAKAPTAAKDDVVDRLVFALENMSRGRPSSRQTQELPIFDGDPREWLPFKAAMRDSTALYHMSPSENLARLRACLRGEARQAVSALLYSATEPTQILRTLEQCFGRPGAIIDQAVNEVLRLPSVGSTANELNMFAVKVQNVVTVIESIDPQGKDTDPRLPRTISEKLSPHLKSKWYDYAYESREESQSELGRLASFLMREADRAIQFSHDRVAITNTRPVQRIVQPRPIQKRSEIRKPVYATAEGPSKTGRIECLCCGAGHRTYVCDKIAAMSVQQRWEWAKDARICFRCLDSRHRKFACRSKNCGVDECRRPHHALLHTSPRNIGCEESGVESVTAASAHMPTDKIQVLLKVCPVTLKGSNGREVHTHALLDEGSTITLVDEEIAASIGARGPIRALNIVGATSSQQEPGSRVVCMRVRGQNGHSHEIKARTVRNLTLGNQSIERDFLKYPHLKRIPRDVVCYANAKPRVLIGADNWHLIVSRKLVTGNKKQPAASLTQLGWVLHGSVPRSVVVEKAMVLHVRTQQQCIKHAHTDDQLSDLVKAHYDIDAIGITPNRKPIPSETRAVSITKQTAKRVNGRFEVGLPWVSDDVTLPPSYSMACRRLQGIERKMDKSPAFKEAYTRQVNALLDKGYAEPNMGQYVSSDREWYLPHFAVTNPNKPGKLRLVFDAAARANEKCLNDVLLDGPDLLQSLNGILFGFRARRVALTADIREMFLQVKIRKEDRVAQQFLWRGDDRKNPPQKYVMSSMIFGARSSPFLAHSIRDMNATEFKDAYPLAYDAITGSTYMDDWIDSFDSEEEAARTISEVRHVHAQAGFELAGWSSNREAILSDVPTESRAHAPKELATNAHLCDKALGVLWLPRYDELGFNTEMHRVPEDVKNLTRTPTKREALGVVMSIFDPLGLLSPYTITAKILLQELWREKIGWDESIPHEQATAFAEWQADLKCIADLRVPRCYDTRNSIVDRQLHVFCDASEQAYAAVAYWRFRNASGKVKLALVAGKAKVAPLKAQSIPRMELQAAVIGSRLATDVISKHPWKDAVVYLWSDSKTVLSWIRNDANRYTPYVAHRLSEIAEATRTEQWKWVPTALNVADDATRAGNTQLSSSSRWYTGPPFLCESEERWPVECTLPLQVTEALVTHTTSRDSLIEIERFSSYDRLVRALSYVLLFVDKCRKRAASLGIKHIREAERLIIMQAQSHSFESEIARLRQGKHVDRSSRLFKLDPVYDEDGIVRLNGRIDAANIPAQRKNPPILDGSSHLVRLYIRREHVHSNHSGREQLVNNIRQKFWVLRLRPAVRTVISDCVMCKARRAAPLDPVKGDLPALRLQSYTRPFSYCGVDCYGPMWVTIGRRREKRWGMLFTCLVTRGIHIELIASLSTESAIMAIRRMAARRGMPHTMVSDNGTNFHGADVELRRAYREWLPEIEKFALRKHMDWRFIDPGAPNQGGAWERMIRSVKSAMLVTLTDRAPKEEILATLTTEIEHTINSRPLTHVPVNADDPEALTPNHFLLGSAVGLPFVGNCAVADRRAWRAAQALADIFWKRWISEYLPTLAPRGDNRNNRSNVKPGDVVIIADGLLPRNVWPRGLVEHVYTGPDGVVRSAEVRTKGGIFRRPVCRLIVLPVDS